MSSQSQDVHKNILLPMHKNADLSNKKKKMARPTSHRTYRMPTRTYCYSYIKTLTHQRENMAPLEREKSSVQHENKEPDRLLCHVVIHQFGFRLDVALLLTTSSSESVLGDSMRGAATTIAFPVQQSRKLLLSWWSAKDTTTLGSTHQKQKI